MEKTQASNWIQVDRKKILQWVPSLAFTDQATTFKVIKIITNDNIYLTIYYTEPDDFTYVIYGVVNKYTADPEAGGIAPKDLRILRWLPLDMSLRLV